jgi:hypothetical protein
VLVLREEFDEPRKNQIIWRWVKRPEESVPDFGDPTRRTGYALCVYDFVAGEAALVTSVSLGPGSSCGSGEICWEPIGRNVPGGFRFQNREQVPFVSEQLLLKAREASKGTKILFSARGERLVFSPPTDGKSFLSQESRLVVQLVNSDGGCWESDYSLPAITNRRNNIGNFFKDRCGSGSQGRCE